MRPEPQSVVHVDCEPGQRILVPQHFSKHVSWMRGANAIQCWLYLIEPGRYSLLSDQNLKDDAHLESVRDLLVEGEVPAAEPTQAEGISKAAIVARLARTTISPHRASSTDEASWRLTFPKVFEIFAPPDYTPTKLSVMVSIEGYLEIWYTDLLRKAVLG